MVAQAQTLIIEDDPDHAILGAELGRIQELDFEVALRAEAIQGFDLIFADYGSRARRPN